MLSKKESTQSIGQSERERESHEDTQKGERETKRERDTKMERHRELWKLPIEHTETGKS